MTDDRLRLVNAGSFFLAAVSGTSATAAGHATVTAKSIDELFNDVTRELSGTRRQGAAELVHGSGPNQKLAPRFLRDVEP